MVFIIIILLVIFVNAIPKHEVEIDKTEKRMTWAKARRMPGHPVPGGSHWRGRKGFWR